jgi:hypothetical protein
MPIERVLHSDEYPAQRPLVREGIDADQVQVERFCVHHVRVSMKGAHFKIARLSLPSGRPSVDVQGDAIWQKSGGVAVAGPMSPSRLLRATMPEIARSQWRSEKCKWLP